MEPEDLITLVIYVVWGILSIILFFKVWGMTNDVRELRNKYVVDEKNVSLYVIVAKYMQLGDREKAKEVTMERMNSTLQSLMKDVGHAADGELQENWNKYVVSFERIFKFIGEPMPEAYRNFSFKRLAEDRAAMRGN